MSRRRLVLDEERPRRRSGRPPVSLDQYIDWVHRAELDALYWLEQSPDEWPCHGRPFRKDWCDWAPGAGLTDHAGGFMGHTCLPESLRTFQDAKKQTLSQGAPAAPREVPEVPV